MPITATLPTHPLAVSRVPPFEQVDVTHSVPGGTLVEWVLKAGFCEPEPYVFQLQAADTDAASVNWQNVGNPVSNVFYAYDNAQRSFGKELTSYYRVQLVTAWNHTYYSEPVPAAGQLSRHEWGYAREIIRKERLNQRRTAVPGWLFKAKRAGTICPICVDPDLGQPTNSKCRTCYGLRIQGGYYPGVEDYAALLPVEHDLKRNLQKGPMDESVVIRARMLASPYPAREDVWVNRYSDERYLVRKVTDKSELRGIPLIVEVELRLAPFDDVVYSLPRPDAG